LLPPPTQIRAGGFPEPGSCLRSHVIGLRGIGYACGSVAVPFVSGDGKLLNSRCQ